MNPPSFAPYQPYVFFCILLLSVLSFIFLFDPAGARVYDTYHLLMMDSSKGSHVNTWVKMLTGTLGIMGLMAGLLACNKWVRRGSWALFILMTFVNGGSEFLVGEEINIHHYETAVLEARGFAGDFFRSVQMNLLGFSLKFFGTLLVIAYLFWTLRKYSFIPSLWILGFGILACGITVVRTKGSELVGPSAFTLPQMILCKHTLSGYNGPRDEVKVQPIQEPEADVIILVIDESIRGDYLSINRKEIGTTPYLEGIELINFGIASSAGNCSRQSNIMIRVGLRPQDIPDQKNQVMKNPSLFDYAVKAGLKTAYGTNQIQKGYQNYMNSYEAKSIHRYEILGKEGCSAQAPCGDAEIISFIKEVLASHKKIFLLVNKNGAHFPYADRVAPQHASFKPFHQKGEAHLDPLKTINTYKNAVRWTVDGFFQHLMPVLEGKKYIVIYTSDHGEHVEAAKNGIGHGSTFTLPKEEAMVPLFVITNMDSLSERLKQGQEKKAGKATHFDIFPTLLTVMGYDPQWVRQNFGPCLWEEENHPQKTYTGSLFYYGKWHSHTSF